MDLNRSFTQDAVSAMSLKPKHRSLKGRLTIVLMVVIGIPLILVGAALAITVPQLLRAQFDDSLETRARALVSLTIIEDGEFDLEFSDQFMPEFESDENPYFFEVWADGEEVERSRSFHPERGVRLPDLVLESEISDDPRLRSIPLPDGRSGRQVRVDFVPDVAEEDDEEDEEEEEAYEEDDELQSPTQTFAEGSGTVASVIVAGSTEDLDIFIAKFRILVLAITGVLLVLLTVFIRVALTLGLNPLQGVMEQVTEIDAESLGDRLDLSASPSELKPLLEDFNRLLDRVETAFRRERQLTADMAHELKTPIAELRSLGDVGKTWPEDREAVVSFFCDAKSIAQQMERVVFHLLALARHDAGRHVIEESVLPLREQVKLALRPYSEGAIARGLTIKIEIDSSLHIVSDAAKLEIILTNLISNSVSYGKPNSTIICEAGRHNGFVELIIRNETDNLQPEDIPVMFDRFWRKDEARSDGQSAGLGLALVRAFSHLLGIRENAHLSPNGVFEIVLQIPAADDQEDLGPRSATG